jgi:hypothetical protein
MRVDDRIEDFISTDQNGNEVWLSKLLKGQGRRAFWATCRG